LIRFFIQLQEELKGGPEFATRPNTPTGEAWQVLAPAGGVEGAGLYYIAAFAPDNQFRLELYIDTGDRIRNNRIFDALAAQRWAVEDALGSALSWERMDDRRAARVAWIHSGSISDPDEELANLRTWAADAARRFAAVLDPLVAGVVGALNQTSAAEV
jgi:hypothetical protein